MFFGATASVEVRDGDMRLVRRLHHFDQSYLPQGLYEVSAVLEDGRKHSAIVQVKAGEETPVEFAVGQETELPDQQLRGEAHVARRLRVGSQFAPSYERPRFTQKIAELPKNEPSSTPDVTPQLLYVDGAKLVSDSRNLWIFECVTSVNAVPSVSFKFSDHIQTISLPISPGREFPYNSCAVRLEKNFTSTRLDAWILPERTVANAMQNMLASGYVLEAAGVADDAIELLRDKYQDPTGAALGALILHKTGRLAPWTSWVENLARDFDWLPDGKVILADLLRGNESLEDRNAALELATQASNQRLLFTESYSLLLSILRSTTESERSEEVAAALNLLSSHAPDVAWDVICLSNQASSDDK